LCNFIKPQKRGDAIEGVIAMINLRKTLAASSLALGIAATAAPAAAQYYTLNGQMPPSSVARYMAAHGLPSGDYWLTNQGYWGVMGSNAPLGNIYAGSSSSRPHRSLSEQRRLYYPGEILNGH
jgi:hypothetical protein